MEEMLAADAPGHFGGTVATGVGETGAVRPLPPAVDAHRRGAGVSGDQQPLEHSRALDHRTESAALRYELLTAEQRRNKIRTAAAQAAALSAARKEMPKLRYGTKEHSAPTARGIQL